MAVAPTFRAVYFISLAFGIFPYEPVGSNRFHLHKFAQWQGRFMLWLLIVVRSIILIFDIKFNFYSPSRTFMTIFRIGNGLLIHFMTIIIYLTARKFRRSMCCWLNKISKLYSSVQGNSRAVLNFNRCCICYSLFFYGTTNIVTLILLWKNGKFINGWIAFSDSLCFVFLLSIQNLYLCGFLTMMNLAKMSFARINDVFKMEKLRCATGSVLLKKLQWLRTQHLAVTDFLDLLMSVFGFYLLIYIIWSFMSTLTVTISIVIFDFGDAVTLITWLFYHPCQTVPIFYICSDIVEEAKKSVNFVHELLIENEDGEIKEEMEIFSLQLQHRPTDFSVCEFFNLNFKLIVSSTGVVATYIIALIQMHQPAVYKEAAGEPDNF